ncbi:MAG: energy-coupled thiamine transporter ThiT [Bacilli bacterium]
MEQKVIKEKTFTEKMVAVISENRTIILDVVALVAGVIGIILSLFAFAKIKDFEGTKVIVTGIEVFFGTSSLLGFNVIAFFIFLLPLLGLVSIPMSHFFKPIKGMSALFLLASAILIIILPSVLIQGIDGPRFEYVKLQDFAAIASALYFLSGIALFISDYQNDKFSISDIAETAMLIAIAVVLNYIKVPLGATGGSINLQIVPLVIIALRYSPSKTFFATGLCYGLISCILDGYGLHTFPFEYLIAFGSVVIISFVRKYVISKGKPTIIGGALILFLVMIATGIRFFGASFDSVIFYDYTWTAAFAYNAIYVWPTGALTAVVAVLFYIKPLFFLNRLFPTTDMKRDLAEKVVVEEIAETK